ncbi:hypothetical protein LVJ94_36650 [Pendulispora rubella]|uniref:Uncharacterized protein n=1 Tax=Pendulispora rubella TaxID=2741070 RepID=A0ABZ2KUS4_9BACT
MNVAMGQVNETIATKHEIRLGKTVLRQVTVKKSTAGRSEVSLIVFDQSGDNIDTYIMDARQVDVAHPKEVSAWRIEQSANFQFSDQRWERFSNGFTLHQVGAHTGEAARVTPGIGAVHLGKYLLR